MTLNARLLGYCFAAVGLSCGIGLAARTPHADPTPPPSSASFKKVAALFKQKCVSCHNAKNHAEGVDLSSYNAIVKGKKTIVVAGKPEKSAVVAYIDGTNKPLMPMGGKKLSDADIKLVHDWVKAGAKNN